MEYSQYRKARDSVWRLLVEIGAKELPVMVHTVCRRYGLQPVSYKSGKEMIEFYHLQPSTEGNDGFSIPIAGSNLIFYNQACSVARQRFVIAHEVGHYLLGHVGKYELTSREPTKQDNPIEKAANIFASRLLAPACVLWGIGVRSPEEVAEVCGISLQSAAYRYERLEMLRKRGSFLHSPLEQKVYANFLPFIIEQRVKRGRDAGEETLSSLPL